MATIQATVVQTGFANASKSYTLADSDMSLAIEAFQTEADRALGAPASRNQVLTYMFDRLIVSGIQTQIQNYKRVPASIPPPISIS